MEFPIYRKYSNGKSYFVITSEKTWIEYKQVGKKFLQYEFTATQFPEMMFVKDLMAMEEGIEASSEEEIRNLLK